MLTKNVYLLYRPGYSGSYINWAINISDIDSREHTVKDPLNRTNSEKFGGIGTSHNHLRIPTHQSYKRHVRWMLLNRPQSPNIYVINEGGVERDIIISDIFQYDRDGIIISIHGGPNWKTAAYGYINGVRKWPTRIAVAVEGTNKPLNFDPFNCSNDINARNWFVENEQHMIRGEPSVNYDNVQYQINRYFDWYRVRNKYQPHEVNSDTYIDSISTTNRIFELSCYDVSSEIFVKIFANIMKNSQISNNYDLSAITDFHTQYCQVQENLQWFTSVDNWLLTGQLDSYLLSHSSIEACIISYIFTELNVLKYHNDDLKWLEFYNTVKDPSWPECNTMWDFPSLPQNVQDELINNFDVIPRKPEERTLLELHNNWKNMPTVEINDWYQQYKYMYTNRN